jgi:hypothetical protein
MECRRTPTRNIHNRAVKLASLWVTPKRPMLEPTIVKITVDTTANDTARAGALKDRHRSSLPIANDKRITTRGKPKNERLPTMLWMVPISVASAPTSIGKRPASSSETP